MNNYDHYKEAQSIISMLQGTSLSIYSEKLKDSMEKGSTGTEIFMALRWNIERLLKEKNLNRSVRDRAQRLWEELDKSL